MDEPGSIPAAVLPFYSSPRINRVSKAIAVLALLGLTFVVQFLVMTHAWGLQLQSWGWYLGGIAASFAISGAMVAVREDK